MIMGVIARYRLECYPKRRRGNSSGFGVKISGIERVKCPRGTRSFPRSNPLTGRRDFSGAARSRGRFVWNRELSASGNLLFRPSWNFYKYSRWKRVIDVAPPGVRIFISSARNVPHKFRPRFAHIHGLINFYSLLCTILSGWWFANFLPDSRGIFIPAYSHFRYTLYLTKSRAIFHFPIRTTSRKLLLIHGTLNLIYFTYSSLLFEAFLLYF